MRTLVISIDKTRLKMRTLVIFAYQINVPSKKHRHSVRQKHCRRPRTLWKKRDQGTRFFEGAKKRIRGFVFYVKLWEGSRFRQKKMKKTLQNQFIFKNHVSGFELSSGGKSEGTKKSSFQPGQRRPSARFLTAKKSLSSAPSIYD